MLTKQSIKLLSLLFLLALLGFHNQVNATPVVVTGGGKSKPVRIQVFATFLTFRFGDPLIDEDLPAGDKREFTVNVSGVTDISVVEKFISPDGTTRTATNSYGPVMVDPATGQFTMPPLGDYLAATLGIGNTLALPDLANDSFDVFLFVDINQFIAQGGTQPPVGTIFSVVNGISPQLPGVLIGLSEIHLDPNLGLVNSNPFTGDVYALGTVNITATPEPATMLLLGTGLAGVGAAVYRRRKHR